MFPQGSALSLVISGSYYLKQRNSLPPKSHGLATFRQTVWCYWGPVSFEFTSTGKQNIMNASGIVFVANSFGVPTFSLITLCGWQMPFVSPQFFQFDKSRHPTLAKLLFFYFMLFVTVLLMNMLIAMMANTYQNVSVTTSLKLQKKKLCSPM